MKKLFSIIAIVIILAGVSIFEEIYSKHFISTLSSKADQTSIAISSNKENIDNNEVKTSYNDLKKYWDKSKTVLCFFTNYEKIKAIDESIIKVDTAIKHNEVSLAIENISIIKEYEKIFKSMIGFNINNLF